VRLKLRVIGMKRKKRFGKAIEQGSTTSEKAIRRHCWIHSKLCFINPNLSTATTPSRWIGVLPLFNSDLFTRPGTCLLVWYPSK